MWFKLVRANYIINLEKENTELKRDNEELLEKLRYIKAVAGSDISLVSSEVTSVNSVPGELRESRGTRYENIND